MTQIDALKTDEIQNYEIEHQEEVRRLAGECMVILENDGVLPLQAGTKKIALFGTGARHTIKGGTGSGDVNVRENISIAQGLERAGFKFVTEGWLDQYDRLYADAQEAYAKKLNEFTEKTGKLSMLYAFENPFEEPEQPEITEADVKEADAAIYVISRNSGEGKDRRAEKGDYYLSDRELQNIRFMTEHYKNCIVLLNVGGVIDLTSLKAIEGVQAIMLVGQTGNMGGYAVADVLTAKTIPSGKLTDTWAKSYEDYPSSATFSHRDGNLDDEYYSDGIYVGYRYFDTFHVAPRYPFGYGMSYTNFAIRFEQMQMEGTKIHVYTEVENTGRIYDGKEVVQIYVSCPNGELKKEAQRLTAFHKTKLLKPGEKEKLILSFDLRDMTSYRKKDAATVLEKGEYVIRLGNSSRNTRVCGILRLSSEIITEKHSHICKIPMHVTELEQKEEDILHSACDCRQNWGRGCEIIIENMEKIRSIPVEEDKITEIVHEYGPVKIYSSEETDAVMERLTLRDMAELSVGGGMTGSRFFEAPGAAGVTCTTLEQKGIPNVVMADGPAGLRLNKVSSVSFTGKVKGIEPNISCMKYLPELVKKIMLGNPDSPHPHGLRPQYV